MFVAPLIRWLANHHNPLVVLGVGVTLVCAAIGISAVGIAIHQTAVTRIGVLLVIPTIMMFVIRSRRDRTSQRGNDE